MLGRSQPGEGALGGDDSLSEAHARVAPGASGGWEVCDLGSDGGTFLNGKSLVGSAELHRGDMLRMGSSKLLVLQGPARPAAATAVLPQRPETPPREPAAQLPAQSEPLPYEPPPDKPPPDEPPPMLRAPAHRIAPLRRRWRAAFIDNVLLLPLAFGLSRLFGGALIAVAAALALTLIYDFLCESLRGQTIGKRVSKIRVVRRDGSPLRPQHCAARNVLRFIDTFPGVPLVGLLSMTASGKYRRQRLGDLAAGTLVVESEARRAR
ncbi:MAG TPA: RDD family protein, partial [Thermoleophilaceae bacterium]|nr:RDD family protein [Thermoleophilaceae bacterium]